MKSELELGLSIRFRGRRYDHQNVPPYNALLYFSTAHFHISIESRKTSLTVNPRARRQHANSASKHESTVWRPSEPNAPAVTARLELRINTRVRSSDLRQPAPIPAG